MPEIAHSIHFILCRNFIHFLNTKRMNDFFQLLKTISAPGGEVILTANSIYAAGEVGRNERNRNPNVTSYEVINIIAHDYLDGGAPHTLTQYFHPCNDSSPSMKYDNYVVYSRTLSQKWTYHQDTYRRINSPVKAQITAIINMKKPIWQSIKSGEIRVLINRMRFFSCETLSDLCKQHGFGIKKVFCISPNGHVLPADNESFLFGIQSFIGVLIKNLD